MTVSSKACKCLVDSAWMEKVFKNIPKLMAFFYIIIIKNSGWGVGRSLTSHWKFILAEIT